MCMICDNNYDEHTTKIWCCDKIKTIPNLINLEVLDCTNTKISKLPNLPKLKILYCSGSNITAIPYNLEWVECRKTCITKVPDCEGIYNTCKWLEPSDKNLRKLIILQKYFRKKTKIRKMIINSIIRLNRNLLYLLSTY
jgi:Leucine-rich repeat (LRR) protein